MCVVLLFLFGYFLSTRCVYPQIGRAFEAPIGHKTLLCGHIVLLAPFIAYFLKNNYSRRQNTLKILRVWERSHILVSIGVYLALIWIGTWLGESVTKRRRTVDEGGLDSQSEHLVMQYRELMMYSISPASGAKLKPRQINSRRNTGNDQTQLCVRSWEIGHVWSRREHFLELSVLGRTQEE